MTEKTLAVLMDGNYVIGFAHTAAKNGEMVSYGEPIKDSGPLHQIGRAKISRAQKNLKEIQENNYPEYAVNYGGGPAV